MTVGVIDQFMKKAVEKTGKASTIVIKQITDFFLETSATYSMKIYPIGSFCSLTRRWPRFSPCSL